MVNYQEGFGSFAVADLDEAEKFYKEILKLPVQRTKMGVLEVSIKNCKMIIYPKSDYTPAVFTVFNLVVSNLENTVDKLIAEGFIFEQYDGEIKTNGKGIFNSENGPTIAWFKDPSGNIISLIEANS